MKIKRKINNRLVKYFIIPICFLILGFGLSILFNRTVPFSIIQHFGSINSFSEHPGEKLLRGKIIKGFFIAQDNYLGIVTIRFNDFIKINYTLEDVLLFKIREKSSKDWYYLNTYRTGILQNSLLIPFGFPIIQGSKNKTYQFEIKSLAGNNTNSVQLSKTEPILTTSYSFPKWEIFGSKQRLINYLIKKVSTSILSIDYLLSSLIFFLPLLLYLLFLLSIKFSNLSKKLIKYVSFILIVTDALFLKSFYLGVFLLLLILWGFFIIKLKQNSKNTIIYILILLLLSIFFTFLNRRFSAERIDIWIYTLLIIACLQLIFEEKKYKLKNNILKKLSKKR